MVDKEKKNENTTMEEKVRRKLRDFAVSSYL
jgi:hypothetical protein